MAENFMFGHTIIPEQEEGEDESESLGDLFVIGKKKIQGQIRKEEESDVDSCGSAETQKMGKKVKKEKKKHKGKQKKKHKHQHKEKHKKQKHKKLEQTLEIYQPQKLTVFSPSIEEKISQQFALNQTIGDFMLKFDIIQFPMPSLYSYGLMEKQVPRYRRLENFHYVIGVRKSKQKKYRDFIKEINRKINQRQKDTRKYEEKSQHRYFHFEGYEECTTTKIATVPEYDRFGKQFIIFVEKSSNPLEQSENLKITKSFNRRLNENPTAVQVWLEYIKVQEHLVELMGSRKQRNAVLQRRIDVVEKALSFNGNNTELAKVYLILLHQKELDIQLIAKKCWQFINLNPENHTLYKIYLMLSTSNFTKYSHTYLQTMSLEIIQFLGKNIDKMTSTNQIFNLRRICLSLLSMVLKFYRLEGFGELATGVVTAILEFNFFMPEEVRSANGSKAKQQFREYWENYESYRVGSVEEIRNWSINEQSKKEKHKKNDTYIGSYQQTPKKSYQNWIQKQKKKLPWYPSHPLHDKSIIKESPESFILFEDIQSHLLQYRDNESLRKLIDVCVENLGFLVIFGDRDVYGIFSGNFMDKTLISYLGKAGIIKNGVSFRNWGSYCWYKYFNPSLLSQFIEPQKLKYLIRILQNIKINSNFRSQLNEYLTFLYCSIYLSTELQSHLNISSQEAMQKINQFMSEQSMNYAIWSMYIDVYYLKNRNFQECMDCYWELIVAAEQKSLGWLLVCLCCFGKSHKIDVKKWVLWIYYNTCVSKNQMQKDRTQCLSVFELLSLDQHFKNLLENLKINQQNIKQSSNYFTQGKIAQLYLIQIYCQTYFHQSVEEISLQSRQLLLNIGKSLAQWNNKEMFHLMRWILISFRLLDLSTFERYPCLLQKSPTFEVIEEWVHLYTRPVCLFEIHFNKLANPSLTLWLAACIFLYPLSTVSISTFPQQFFRISKKLTLKQSIETLTPESSILVNKLLQYDVENNKQFVSKCLSKMPYSKTLFLMYADLCYGQEKSKTLEVILQKGIRIWFREDLEKELEI